MIYKRKKRDKATGKMVELPYWHYKFTRNGVQVNVNTKQKDKQTAREMESAKRTELAKGESGFETGSVPTLKQFSARFIKGIETRCAEKPNTVDFYKRMLKTLLTFPPLANTRLNRIDEGLIERYVQHRRAQFIHKSKEAETGRTVSPATVNRELATLRRALHLAEDWKLIRGLPKIEMLAGEKNREFVLAVNVEAKYLATAPEPLHDVAVLIVESALRPGEALALRWSDVHLDPGVDKKLGYVQVRSGKSKNARRSVSLSARANAMLRARKQNAVNDLVFPGDSLEEPFLVSSLDHQHAGVRAKLGLPSEFVIHSLRHTALTRLGDSGADAFTIMRIAGHSSITISQRYVHPSNDAMEAAFEKRAKVEGTLLGTLEKLNERESAQVLYLQRTGA